MAIQSRATSTATSKLVKIACQDPDHDTNVLSNYLDDAADYEEALAEVVSLYVSKKSIEAILVAPTYVQRLDCPIESTLAEINTDLLDAVDRLCIARDFLATAFPLDPGNPISVDLPLPPLPTSRKKVGQKKSTKH